jgi:hypothetical protein
MRAWVIVSYLFLCDEVGFGFEVAYFCSGQTACTPSANSLACL